MISFSSARRRERELIQFVIGPRWNGHQPVHVQPQGKERRRTSELVWLAGSVQHYPIETAFSEFSGRPLKLRELAQNPRTESEATAWRCLRPVRGMQNELSYRMGRAPS